MNRANMDIRQFAKEKGVFLWEVAQRYGCNDGNFARRLRTELPKKEKEIIRQYIKEIAEEHKHKG